jgi:hypothetical protein
MKHRSYFDATGREVTADDALDRHGSLRDTFSMRIPTIFRDSKVTGAGSKADKANSNRITDGRTDDATALHRPGFRVPVVNDRRSVRDAYATYERSLVNAYRIGDGKQCPVCEGAGEDEDGNECERCEGTGTISKAKDEREDDRGSRKASKHFGSTNESHHDSRTLDQVMRDHEANMSKLYSALDAELTQAWRTR